MMSVEGGGGSGIPLVINPRLESETLLGCTKFRWVSKDVKEVYSSNRTEFYYASIMK